MEDVRAALLELQTIDQEIVRVQLRIQEFQPQLDALEQPIRNLEQEIENTRMRLAELRQTARKLEQSAEQKRDRLRNYEARMERVRTLREESAARTELDLIRRATEADETEALESMEQATRTDLKLDDLSRQLDKQKADIAPRRDEVLRARQEAEAQLNVLKDRRHNHSVRLDAPALRLYERVRSGRSRSVLAPLTVEGACGNCYNVLPIQAQSEVRRDGSLVRCEACGVILYPAPAA
jgi:predicted  nucleic acid-binding Zn-ribbon protein